MPLTPEIITSLNEKAAAKERAIELDKEAQRAARMAQFKAEESERLRADALRKEMEEINTQIKAGGQLQDGLRLFIEENPSKTAYETKVGSFIGLPIAQKDRRAAVLTQKGIRTFAIDHLNWPDHDQIPNFEAEEITLTDADIENLLPQAEFPSADALSLKITKLLGI